MTASDSSGALLSLPPSVLTALRRAVEAEAGEEGAERSLRSAGSEAGESIFDRFADHMDSDPRELSDGRFWSELSSYLSSHGWGTISHERVHPGLGLVRAEQWSECDPKDEGDQPTCWFTAGMLTSLLARAADGPIAVIETSCRTRGDAGCSFLFGSSPAVEGLRAALDDHPLLEDALARL